MRLSNFSTSACAPGGRACKDRSPRRKNSPLSLSLLALGVAVAGLNAAEQTVQVTANTPAKLELPWPYDQSALQEPRGYNHHGLPARHLVSQLVIENTGAQPLENVDVLVDGHDWLDRVLPGAADAGSVFTAWTQMRSHAASGLKAAGDPWQMLRIWSYTLCGEDTKSLSILLAGRKIAGRSVPLNGHVAGEYEFDGRWSIIDGDQNIVYLNLDNRTLASYADLRADPLLALRTKPFGRFAKRTTAAAQFNTGLFEYIEPANPKPFKQKKGDEAAPPVLTLYPGERLIYHYDQSPETQVGDAGAPEWRAAAPAALRILELQASPRARGWKKGPLEFQSAYPVLSAKNLDTGSSTEALPIEAIFRFTVPVNQATDRISILMQCSQFSLPRFHPGVNSITLAGKGQTSANVKLVYDAEHLPPQPAAPVITGAASFRDTAPSFQVACEANCDRVWWQIASDPQFRFVPPNFDQIEKTPATIAVDALSNTFFNDGGEHYLRVKTVRQGVWSPWSTPMKFQVEKPAAPTELTAGAGTDGHVHLQWKGAGEEFAIFASNRLDFLPDVYEATQVVSMRSLEVLAQRPNRNLVATLNAHSIDLVPTGRYYRVLTRRGEAWSNPGPLLVLPAGLCRNLPPPVVFQIRWTNTGGTDVYLGEERPLLR